MHAIIAPLVKNACCKFSHLFGRTNFQLRIMDSDDTYTNDDVGYSIPSEALGSDLQSVAADYAQVWKTVYTGGPRRCQSFFSAGGICQRD
jgi:hypothetical protein